MINGQRILKGIDSVVLDSASLNVMIQSIVPPPDDDGKVIVQILSHNGDSIMVGEILMGKWHLTTTNATERGCLCDIVASGMLKATFSPGSNKLLYMEQTFDVMSFMQQLRQASGKFEFFVSDQSSSNDANRNKLRFPPLYPSLPPSCLHVTPQ